MTKYILTTIMMALLTLCAPVQVRANAAIEIIENDFQPTDRYVYLVPTEKSCMFTIWLACVYIALR